MLSQWQQESCGVDIQPRLYQRGGFRVDLNVRELFQLIVWSGIRLAITPDVTYPQQWQGSDGNPGAFLELDGSGAFWRKQNGGIVPEVLDRDSG
jgi:hypothetical protein